MIYPSIHDLTRGKYNRYTLVVATARCARMVTDEYVKQREYAEKLINNKETDKSLASMIKREYRDEKAVKSAINKLYSGEFKIVDAPIVVKSEHLHDGYRKTIRGAVYGDDEAILSDDILLDEDDLLDDDTLLSGDDVDTGVGAELDIIEGLIPAADDDIDG